MTYSKYCERAGKERFILSHDSVRTGAPLQIDAVPIDQNLKYRPL